jgi:hypothetical protein
LKSQKGDASLFGEIIICMPTLPRAIIAGVHHITPQGNRREDVFFTYENRKWYHPIFTKEIPKLILRLRSGQGSG